MSRPQLILTSGWQPLQNHPEVTYAAHPHFEEVFQAYQKNRMALPSMAMSQQTFRRQDKWTEFRHMKRAEALSEGHRRALETMEQIVIKRWDEEDPAWRVKIAEWRDAYRQWWESTLTSCGSESRLVR